MKNFKAKIASIHEDLELRRSLEIEEDKTPTFDDKDWILRDVYGHIKRTIKTFDREWYNKNTDADPVNDLMAAFKQAADLIESRYTGGPRTTFFNADEDIAPLVPRKEPEIGGRGTITITKPDPKDGERKLLISMSDPDGVPDIKYGGIDFKDLSTGETVTSPERIRVQLERALRFELGFTDVTSAATNDSRAAGGKLTEKGKWDVSILWNKERDPDTGEFYPLESGNTWEFKLVPTQLK